MSLLRKAVISRRFARGFIPPWGLIGWGFRKGHTINGAVGAGTNYQIRVKVHYGSGLDSGEDVYCSGHCRTDFGDIRFTDDDRITLLDYWLQKKLDGDYAIFWVKVTDDLGSNQTIYIYYGKTDAETTSNGVNTFIFFDDFRSEVLDTDKWSNESQAAGQVIPTADYLKLYSPAGGNTMIQIFSKQPFDFSGAAKLEYDWNLVTLPPNHCSGGAIGSALERVEAGYSYLYYYHEYQGDNMLLQEVHNSIAYADSYPMTLTLGIWRHRTLAWTGTTLYGTLTNPSHSPTRALQEDRRNKDRYISLNANSWASGDGPKTVYVRDLFVRKYVDPEPTHGSWGKEERH